MTDTDLGASLSPAEQSYFESGGTTEIPASETDTGGAASGGEGGGDTPAPKPETGNVADAGKDGDGVEKVVKLAALHEERTRRKEVERQHRQTQQELAELRGKFSVLDKIVTPPAAEPPTVETDIFGVVKNTTTTVDDIKKRLDARDAALAEQAKRNELIDAYKVDAAQFASKTPDFMPAYEHLLASRSQELIALGHDTHQAVHKALLDDEFAIAQMALASRRSPAEVIYALAKLRGYAPKAATGGAAADKLAKIAEGQQANKSFAAAGGGTGDADMTAEALLKMPMDEFEAWCTKNPKRAQRLMGG